MNRLVLILFALTVTVPALMKSRPGSHEAPLTAFAVCSSDKIIISVDGDVRHAGIYSVSANSVTDSVISLADPLQRPEIREYDRNRKQWLTNGTALHVSRQPDNSVTISIGSIPTTHRMILGIPLDLQRMDAHDFSCLPGIGPVLSERIVKYRQHNGGKLRPSDLLNVEGIGQKKYSVLKKHF